MGKQILWPERRHQPPPRDWRSCVDHMYREVFREEEAYKREKIWKKLPGLRQAKRVLENFYQMRFKTRMEYNRKSLCQFMWFLSCHCKLRQHFTVLGLEIKHMCRYFEVTVETPEHLLTNWHALKQNRIGCLRSYYVRTASTVLRS